MHVPKHLLKKRKKRKLKHIMDSRIHLMAALRSWASLKQGYESKYAPRFKASL